jgi:hypothetical protein
MTWNKNAYYLNLVVILVEVITAFLFGIGLFISNFEYANNETDKGAIISMNVEVWSYGFVILGHFVVIGAILLNLYVSIISLTKAKFKEPLKSQKAYLTKSQTEKISSNEPLIV